MLMAMLSIVVYLCVGYSLGAASVGARPNYEKNGLFRPRGDFVGRLTSSPG